jgi:uncharacterized membrane protein YqjE
MAIDLQSPSSEQQSLTSLLRGIVSDAQELFRQQMALFRTELLAEGRKAGEIMLALAMGLAVLGIGVLMLCWALAFLLNWAFSWPQWAGFLLLGAIFGLLGGVLVYVGRERFRSFSPLPEQSAEALRENLEWKTKPR